jgi:hypothetical protein
MTGAENTGGHDRYCGANKRQGEGCCKRPAGWGTDHPGMGRCKLHGGSTPDHKNAAKVEIARRAVVTYGLPREVTPDVALLEEVHRTAGHVAWLGEVVAGLEQDELVFGLAEVVDKGAGEFPGIDQTAKSAPSVWLDLYQRERAHLVRVSKAAIDAGIAERQVRIAEQQGQMLAKVINRVLDALDLTGEQKARVPEVVPRILRSISSAA